MRGNETTHFFQNGRNLGQANTAQPLIINGSGEQNVVGEDIFCSRKNGLSDYLLMYVHRGCANYLIEGAQQKISAGHVVLYRPGIPQKMHYLAAEHPLIYWVHFTGRDVKNILSACGLENKTVFYVGVDPNLPRYFLQLIRFLKLYEKVPPIRIASEFLQILSGIASSILTPQPEEPSEIKAAAEALCRNIKQDFSCRELANLCNISESHFMHTFKKWAGISPKAFQLRLRMNEACQLLFLTQFSVKEIALRTGYSNPLYFSRLFKKYNGLSPSEYRVKRGQQKE